MKIKENELHSPKVYQYSTSYGYAANAHCGVCGEQLANGFSSKSQEDAFADMKSQLYNYCPNCGARVKEVDE